MRPFQCDLSFPVPQPDEAQQLNLHDQHATRWLGQVRTRESERCILAGCSTAETSCEQVLWTQCLASVSVVPLAIRDCLSPQLRGILQMDPGLLKQLRGDPDDLQTIAAAEFLAPAVIMSADSVFTRLGFSNTTALTWAGIAHRVLRMAGFEATMADAALVAELVGRPLLRALTSAARLAWAHPL